MRVNIPLKDKWILLSLLSIILILFKDILGINILIIIISYWLIRYRDKSFIIVSIILIILFINRFNKNPYTTINGSITKISDSYIIVQDFNMKTIIYTDREYIIDSKVKITGKYKKLYSRPGFFNFDFTKYLNHQGIYYELENTNIIVLKEGITPRALIQKRLNSFSFKNKTWLYKSLLGIKYDDSLESIFIISGFNVMGLILILKKSLNKILYDKTIKKLEMSVLILLGFIYKFPIQIIRLLIFRIFKYAKLNSKDKIGLSIVVLLLIDPSQTFYLGFWILLGFYYSDYLFKRKITRYLYMYVIQGIFNKYFNIVLTFLYGIYIYILGISYIFAIITLMIGRNLFFDFIIISNKIFTILDIFKIKGYPIGLGSIVLIYISYSLRNNKFRWYVVTCLYVLMLKFGYIHILAEVTFINVGQGDSILIRSNFNKTNILIDTGSKYQYSYLKQFLDSKGINKLNALIITHYDEDHSGNINNLKKDYFINTIIDKYNKSFEINEYTFYDLNIFNNVEDNDKSLVHFTKINNLSFLFTGDISSEVEENIIRNYDLIETDILKLAHHGSKTSSSKNFIKQLNPKLSIISSGMNNLYRHPSKEVLDLLENEGVFYLDTKYEGDITIYFTKFFNFFYTSDGRIGII